MSEADKVQVVVPLRARLPRWRVRAGYAVAVLYAWLAEPSVPSLVLGAMIAAMGLLIRGAAAGYLQKNEGLTTGGPYAYTRNPLYLGSTLLAAGLLVAGSSWLAALVVIAYVGIFYPAAMRFEEQHLRKLHTRAYDDYASHVPLFFPRLTPSAAMQDDTPFSWELYKANREQQAAIGAGVAIALLAVKMWLF
ncbi:MAG: methyltransferase family protein [Candidatus Acidiferrales bacterium]